MTATTSRLSRIAGAGLLAGALALSACSNSTDNAGTAAGIASPTAGTSVDKQHNAADVAFAQDMIVHHQAAIEMAEVAASRAQSQEIKDLAGRIGAAQAPEIDEMTSWLAAWGEMTSADSMAGMDHSPMSGMMTDEQMPRLEGASGADFDRMFLRMMTPHHQGAIDMARTEQADGSNPQAIALARSIEASQTAEVAEMEQLLQTL
ncbi:Uncharacterized conserved protein, DUF305 family [Modestobacter sp. DSM 44400]|uniref:DUF305 domain-containing protein n=1 Tax=Modestobacter sp. DSM 44400 TaxID=1550230 RepID=UPI000898AD9E|nr:DUF305 domain-containing protein [Modestobacter sp. DSM 44400]SDY71890.1 Uncharacterized conserved protein, DUF305 family [Modestobacter sp. DSM 44400]